MPGGGAEIVQRRGRANDRRQEAWRRGVYRRPPHGARAGDPHQLHDALRPCRDASPTASRISRCSRDLQDETGGFLAYIPLAYHPTTTSSDFTLPPRARDDGLRRSPEPRGWAPLPRQHRAHQDALDHGHAVPFADVAARSASTTWKARSSARRSTTRPARTRRRR